MRFAASLDMYRKVPGELLEGTKRGSILSVLAISIMSLLFFLETRAFLQTTLVKDLSLDDNPEKRIRVNFNITMMDLPCEYAAVDVVSVLGTDQNITQHVTKYQIDQEGVNKRFHARNKHQHDLIHYDETITETIEELHEDGEDALPLDAEMLALALKENQFVFVDFFASWCSHCRDLAPTWETLAEVMDTVASRKVDEKIDSEREELNAGDDHDWSDEDYDHAVKVELPVMVAKVDCVIHDMVCREQGIMAYPTLRLFVEGKRHGSDYSGHRTVVSLTDYLATVEKEFLRVHGGANEADEIARELHQSRGGDEKHTKTLTRKMKKEWIATDHPGCQLSGFLLLDRTPGNFHIQARSKNHDIVPSMTNVSHEVHHLSFGEPYIRRKLEGGSFGNLVPRDLSTRTNPMDGNTYITQNLHEAHHHYLKVVTTSFKDKMTKRRVYQVLQESQLTFLREDMVPEAQFKYDLSPIAVSYRQSTRKWYDYLTSVMAIVGGTFTVVGMLESGLYAATKKKKW